MGADQTVSFYLLGKALKFTAQMFLVAEIPGAGKAWAAYIIRPAELPAYFEEEAE